jgi:hypothetical protein
LLRVHPPQLLPDALKALAQPCRLALQQFFVDLYLERVEGAGPRADGRGRGRPGNEPLGPVPLKGFETPLPLSELLWRD